MANKPFETQDGIKILTGDDIGSVFPMLDLNGMCAGG